MIFITVARIAIMEKEKSFAGKHSLYIKMAIICLIGISVNLLGSLVVDYFKWPLYFDSTGTILVAVMSGYLPGIIVGLVTNLIKGIFNTADIYYSLVNVLIAIISYTFARLGLLNRKKIWGVFLLILCLGIVGGGHGALLNRFLDNPLDRAALFEKGIWFTFLTDLFDKAVSVILVMLIQLFIPGRLQKLAKIEGWQQNPLTDSQMRNARKKIKKKISLRTKILWLLFMAGIAVGTAALIISVLLYRKYTIEEHFRLAKGTATLVSNIIDGDKVDRYIEEGDAWDEYQKTEAQLYSIRDSSPDILYVYVYQIKPDGCHVVFDLDTDELEGESPGTLVEFDESFEEMIPTLLEGGEIDPIITDDTYGWLITVYQPVYNSKGKCVCYAAADISMDLIRKNELSFMVKLISLFTGFFVLVLAVGLWISEYNIILPINAMSICANDFAYDSQKDFETNVERINRLKIQTGDEIEALYDVIADTTEKNATYVRDVRKKTETIEQMQNALILVLADMVENRDENTGDHVRKTAEYTRIIMDKMRELGYYRDQLTAQFVYDVEHSAPLHDIGKIAVSDLILNKKGKLDDDEYKEMQKHTTAGAKVLQQAIDTIPESGYLKEAKNLAEYHHEKWNGKGYPHGIAGEEIPLSARIMAVADVFDALVSDRCYKKGFPFEKAMGIIKEDAGTHFDPLVADAFIKSSDRVREVMRKFKERSAQLEADRIAREEAEAAEKADKIKKDE